jgi:hypothetical protein
LGLGFVYDNDWTLSITLLDDPHDIFFAFLEKIDFDPLSKNYSAFAVSTKCMPILFPSGQISIFCVFFWDKSEPTEYPEPPYSQYYIGILFGQIIGNSNGEKRTCFAYQFSSEDELIVFTPNKAEKTLEYAYPGQGKVKAYPIPFSAAQGVRQWKGQSLSTNIGSFTDLQDQLAHFSDLLKNQKTWSFSSENFPVDWKGSDYYALRKIRTQYVGSEPESGNVFPKIDR